MKTIFTHKSLKQTLKKTTGLTLLSILCFALAAQVSHQVSVINNAFDPATLNIQVGDTVVWTNNSGFHNVNGDQDTYANNPESFGNNTGTNWTYSYVFTKPGTYDYQCDPHASFGMKGKIIATQEVMLTVNFSGMNPHVDQDLWLSVTEKSTGKEIKRMKKTVEVDFSLDVQEIEAEHSYFVDFFADHNGNGKYDAPPADHAWRMSLDTVDGDEVLDFSHNTNFTDINWKYLLKLQFVHMTPHVGQLLKLYLYDTVNQTYVDTITVESIGGDEFELTSYEILPDSTYHIDFYADLNMNSTYDAPPTDHAWRLVLENVQGDTTLEFMHNIAFTDIFDTQTTNIVQGKNPETIEIYPNPARDFIYISSNEQINANVEITIFNINGQILKLQNQNGYSDNIKLDIHSLPNGTYFVKVNVKSQSSYFKILKIE